MSRYDWMAAASCAQADPGLFHPDHSGHYTRAQRICAACPVRPQCEAHTERLDAVAGRQDQHGMWAGRTRRQREADRVRSAREERRIEARRLIERGGMTPEEIATRLDLSARTVYRIQKVHREQMEAVA